MRVHTDCRNVELCGDGLASRNNIHHECKDWRRYISRENKEVNLASLDENKKFKKTQASRNHVKGPYFG